MELLGTMCGNVLEDWTWVEESIHFKNLGLAYIDEKGVFHFP